MKFTSKLSVFAYALTISTIAGLCPDYSRADDLDTGILSDTPISATIVIKQNIPIAPGAWRVVFSDGQIMSKLNTKEAVNQCWINLNSNKQFAREIPAGTNFSFTRVFSKYGGTRLLTANSTDIGDVGCKGADEVAPVSLSEFSRNFGEWLVLDYELQAKKYVGLVSAEGGHLVLKSSDGRSYLLTLNGYGDLTSDRVPADRSPMIDRRVSVTGLPFRARALTAIALDNFELLQEQTLKGRIVSEPRGIFFKRYFLLSQDGRRIPLAKGHFGSLKILDGRSVEIEGFYNEKVQYVVDWLTSVD